MITISNLSMRYGAKILFRNVNIQFNSGCHYGLVGANGSGKSTFIKILIGECVAEKGNLHIPNQVSIGSLKQDHYLYEEEPILSVVLRGNIRLWEALEKKRILLQEENFNEEHCIQLEDVEQVIAKEDGYTAENEAAKLLEGLGIRAAMHDKPLKFLSGGYKLRVLLAKLLFGKPDILVLDEPTNHLDLFSIKWLEEYLKGYPGALIVSSHDRYFLNQVCTHIADVDCGTIKIYKGNYDDFLQKKAQERELKEVLLNKHEKRRDEIQGFIDRFGAKASKARQAQSKARVVEKLTEEMNELDLTPSSRCYPSFSITPFRASSASALVVKEISKSYGDKKVLKQVSFELEKGDRLAILGPNGIGKSTLLEILTNNVKADSGSFTWGFATKVAYFPQDHAREVKGDMSLLEWLGTCDSTLPQEKLREYLARVLFSGDTVKQSIKTLSGGETARLILAKMAMAKPNILLFDEPTNHLDMEAIEELTRVLCEFEETFVIVSHNRHFVSQVANRIIEISDNGILDFKCSYDEYIEKREQDLLSKPASLRQRYSTPAPAPKDNATTYDEQKKLRGLKTQALRRIQLAEEEVERLEKQIKVIDSKLASEGFFQKVSLDEQRTLINEKNHLDQLLQKALEQWESAQQI